MCSVPQIVHPLGLLLENLLIKVAPSRVFIDTVEGSKFENQWVIFVPKGHMMANGGI